LKERGKEKVFLFFIYNTSLLKKLNYEINKKEKKKKRDKK